jgi:hypothetical protein
MKNLNEYSTGYNTSIGNSQSQEYGGVFGPMDAETVQGKDRFNLTTSEGLHRLNSFLSHFFRRATLNPQNELAQLKVRLNHMNLDFPIDNTQQVKEGSHSFVVTTGTNTFGTTPTTDLSKGFYTRDDLPKYNLSIKISKGDEGFKMEGKLSPHNEVTEEMIRKGNRNKRISMIKKIKEEYELSKAKRAIDVKGEKASAIQKETRRTDRQLKRSR